MNYLATVTGLNPNVDSEVKVDVNGNLICGFVPFGVSYPLEIGKKYNVTFELTILDDLELRNLNTPVREIKQIGNSFAHFIRGQLNIINSTIDAGIELKVNDDLSDFNELDGKYVELRVDRIKVNFR